MYIFIEINVYMCISVYIYIHTCAPILLLVNTIALHSSQSKQKKNLNYTDPFFALLCIRLNRFILLFNEVGYYSLVNRLQWFYHTCAFHICQ